MKFKILPNVGNLFLRATPLYTLPQFSNEFVERCSTHIDPRLPNNSNIPSHLLCHVLRCTNSDSLYMGDITRKEHLNVVTPLSLPQAGVETVRVNYQFTCKNSCPSGMNRRAIDVIFTLEDVQGQVLGRRKLGVRICSCPKRDKDKEEQEYKEKLQSQNQNDDGPQAKKRKIIKKPTPNEKKNVDNSVIKTTFEVLGRDIVVDTLRFALDRMSAEMYNGRYEGEQESKAKECIKNIAALMSKYFH